MNCGHLIRLPGLHQRGAMIQARDAFVAAAVLLPGPGDGGEEIRHLVPQRFGGLFDRVCPVHDALARLIGHGRHTRHVLHRLGREHRRRRAKG